MEDSKKPENPKAFPSPDESSRFGNEGMDLRDYFAAKAMQGIISHFGFKYEQYEDLHSKKAYDVADQMLKQREK